MKNEKCEMLKIQKKSAYKLKKVLYADQLIYVVKIWPRRITGLYCNFWIPNSPPDRYRDK